MPFDLLVALVAFAVAATFSPGPNNIMLMSSGANFGLRRTLPHWGGIILGLVALVLVTGAGLAAVFDLVPGSQMALRIAAVGYLLWLAWKIATASGPAQDQNRGQPMSMAQAAVFQWINPKAWAMALTALGVYAPGHDFGAVLLVAAVLGLTAIPSGATWICLGQQLRRWLTDAHRMRLFNWTMAGLLVLSIGPLLR